MEKSIEVKRLEKIVEVFTVLKKAGLTEEEIVEILRIVERGK